MTSTTTIIPAGYIVQDISGSAIYGTGASADEAWAQVVDEAGPFLDRNGDEVAPEMVRETQFLTLEASQALLDKVRAEGGAIAWRVINGVACTENEAEVSGE